MTGEEKRIGSNMAYLNGGAILVNFAIIALLIGPDSTGYNSTYGVLTDILQLFGGFSAACVVLVAGKLWDWENNFYFGLMSRVVFVVAVVQMLYGVAATATANSVFDTTFNADQVQAFGGATQWFQFVAFGLYGLSLLSVDASMSLSMASRSPTTSVSSEARSSSRRSSSTEMTRLAAK